jgi:putative cell wall-binding protein
VSDGKSLPDVSKAALDQLKSKGSALSRDAQVIKIGSGPPTPENERTALIGGDDPYALAAAIDRFSTVARGDPSPNVIVVSGEDPEWSMPAGAWAARSGDSVLFTRQGDLPPDTERALSIHEHPNIYVLGPEQAVSRKVFDRLRRFGNVRRIEGKTPIANAVAFARYRQGNFGWGLLVPGFHFTIASVDRPVDAAAAAPLATNGIYAPLLLTDTVDTLPKPVDDYFLDLRPGYQNDPRTAVYNHVWILGDTSAISDAVQGRLDEIARLIPVQIAGEKAPGQAGARGAQSPGGAGGGNQPSGGGGRPRGPGGQTQGGGGQAGGGPGGGGQGQAGPKGKGD